MKRIKLTLCSLGLLAWVGQTQAVTVFSDNFNSENGGVGTLNYTGFANWTVSGGTVDLIGNGFFDFYPGNGLYVDLDGSSGQAGTMTSSAIGVTPGNYQLTFDLGGSQRGDVNTVHVDVSGGLASQTYTVNSADPLSLRTIPFTVGAAGTINLIVHNDGGDDVGAILDNVQLESVATPAPDIASTAALLGFAVAGMTALRRKFIV